MADNLTLDGAVKAMARGIAVRDGCGGTFATCPECPCRRQARAALAALSAAPPATRLALIRDLMPDTHAVVPRVPTQEMVDAACERTAYAADRVFPEDLTNALRAMLAAASEAPRDE